MTSLSYTKYAVAVVVCCILSDSTIAASGSNAIAQAKAAQGAVSSCAASRQGQALIDCVADAMDRLSSNVNRGEVPTKAPQIITLASQAATIRGRPKAQALQVLNRVASIARGLAAKTAGDFKPAYSAVASAFSSAISTINRKG